RRRIYVRHTGNARRTCAFDLQCVLHGTSFQRTIARPGERDAGAGQSTKDYAGGYKEQRNHSNCDGLSGTGESAAFAGAVAQRAGERGKNSASDAGTARGRIRTAGGSDESTTHKSASGRENLADRRPRR